MSPLGTFSVFHVTTGIKTATLKNQGPLSSSCQYTLLTFLQFFTHSLFKGPPIPALHFCYGNTSPVGTKKFPRICCLKQVNLQIGGLRIAFTCFLFLGFCGSSILHQPVRGVLAQDLRCSQLWGQLKGCFPHISGPRAGRTCRAGAGPPGSPWSLSAVFLARKYPCSKEMNIPQEREPGGCCVPFDELALKATKNHSCYLLLVRSKSLRPAQYLKRGEVDPSS